MDWKKSFSWLPCYCSFFRRGTGGSIIIYPCSKQNSSAVNFKLRRSRRLIEHLNSPVQSRASFHLKLHWFKLNGRLGSWKSCTNNFRHVLPSESQTKNRFKYTTTAKISKYTRLCTPFLLAIYCNFVIINTCKFIHFDCNGKSFNYICTQNLAEYILCFGSLNLVKPRIYFKYLMCRFSLWA